jgi:hypothetical protein
LLSDPIERRPNAMTIPENPASATEISANVDRVSWISGIGHELRQE